MSCTKAIKVQGSILMYVVIQTSNLSRFALKVSITKNYKSILFHLFIERKNLQEKGKKRSNIFLFVFNSLLADALISLKS